MRDLSSLRSGFKFTLFKYCAKIVAASRLACLRTVANPARTPLAANTLPGVCAMWNLPRRALTARAQLEKRCRCCAGACQFAAMQIPSPTLSNLPPTPCSLLASLNFSLCCALCHFPRNFSPAIYRHLVSARFLFSIWRAVMTPAASYWLTRSVLAPIGRSRIILSATYEDDIFTPYLRLRLVVTDFLLVPIRAELKRQKRI